MRRELRKPNGSRRPSSHCRAGAGQLIRQIESGQRTPGGGPAATRGELGGDRVKAHGQRRAIRHGDGGTAALSLGLCGRQHGAEDPCQHITAAGGRQPSGPGIDRQEAQRCVPGRAGG